METSFLWGIGFCMAVIIAVYTFWKKHNILSIISLASLLVVGLFVAVPSVFFQPFDKNLSDEQCIFLLVFVYFSGIISAIASLFCKPVKHP